MSASPLNNISKTILGIMQKYAIKGVYSLTKTDNSKLLSAFPKEDFDIIHAYHVRMNGGKNGGHSLEIEGKEKFTAHQIPAGVMYKNVKSVIGAGCAFDPVALIDEIKEAKQKGYFNGKLVIDDLAEVGFRTYDVLDGIRSGKKSTGSGIRNIYGHKGKRDGIKVRDLMNKGELEKKLKELIPFCPDEYITIVE